ncbi:MAG: sigma-70 family RNA polymerase sigma factor [Chloroflexota bacterium]
MNRYGDTAQGGVAAARRRAVVELIARYEPALRKTARRFSLDAGDAEDAYQRALEIVLTKAPTTDPRELIRWTQTVTKHEALAVRRGRERLLGQRQPEWREASGADPVATLPSRLGRPDEEVERREDVARTREAMRALRPAELQALSLLAEGYSYVEIGELTGFSQTKVNRVLAEGRSRFREMVSRSEDGRRCRELRPLLSAFCDGETSAKDAETVREHLRACAHCRATMRAYRAAPGLAGVLLPAPLASRSLLGRLRDLLARVGSHVSGTTKLVAATAAGTAAGVAVGVVPVPIAHQAPPGAPAIERSQATPGRRPTVKPAPEPKRQRPRRRTAPVAPSPPVAGEAPEAIEVPPAEAAPSTTESTGSSGSAAGEFGP